MTEETAEEDIKCPECGCSDAIRTYEPPWWERLFWLCGKKVEFCERCTHAI